MLNHALINRLDLAASTKAELTARRRLMPNRHDYKHLAEHTAEVEIWVRSQLRHGHSSTAGDIIHADKAYRGSRPICEIQLVDAILYRAITALIADSLPGTTAKRTPFQDFKYGALEVREARFITKTDIAAYYEFVDHDILADELVSQTGEDAPVDTLNELLGRIMGRRVGLPQIHASSDVLGDTYIDKLRRRLIRKGHQVSTYSDDILISSPNFGSARRALEDCEAEARLLGLVLNERKTYTYGREKYSQSLTTFEEAERKLFEGAGGETESLQLLEGYADEDSDDSPIDPSSTNETSPDQIHPAGDSPENPIMTLEEITATAQTGGADSGKDSQHEAAIRVWKIWLADDESLDHQSNTETSITQSLLSRALPHLGDAGFEDPLDHLANLLHREPGLTPQISLYLTRLAKASLTAPHKIREQLDALTLDESFSSWQAVWLAETAGSIDSSDRDWKHYTWLKDCVADRTTPSALAATAAAALGRLGRGNSLAMAQRMDHIDPAWRTLLLWSLGQSDTHLAKTCADSALDRILIPSLPNS